MLDTGEPLDLEKILQGKWFLPIVKELAELESHSLEALPEIAALLETKTPDWIGEAVRKAMSPHQEICGMKAPDEITALEVGKMLAVKWSVCSAEEHLPELWNNANLKNLAMTQRGTVLGELAGSLNSVLVSLGTFRERLSTVKQHAHELAQHQTAEEQQLFYDGFAEGFGWFAHAHKHLKTASKDQLNRANVYVFAFTRWQEIEEKKAEMSWPEIAKSLDEEFAYGIDINEDTVKKIFQRVGLSGVGKTGRPVKE